MEERTSALTDEKKMMTSAFDYEEDIEDHLHNDHILCIESIAPTPRDEDHEERTSIHRKKERAEG
jgi:hypothetical protein